MGWVSFGLLIGEVSICIIQNSGKLSSGELNRNGSSPASERIQRESLEILDGESRRISENLGEMFEESEESWNILEWLRII